MKATIQNSLQASQRLVQDILADEALQQRLQAAVEACVTCLRGGGKLLFAGNGGSAAEAQHFSAEFVGRFLKEREALASIALHTDTSALTAIGNDYGYEHVFSRQVQALGQRGDILIGLSTSGRSKNILLAMQAAKNKGLLNIALTGQDPRDMGALADIVLNMPSAHTPQIQEGHLIVGHLLCGLVEEAMLA
ncbi:MAG: D-sedoheptulose-7-phosphate isomerase [Burkholderiaceae bacterium]|jgi:D-sedoheptulose 7-phosphate isomerase